VAQSAQREIRENKKVDPGNELGRIYETTRKRTRDRQEAPGRVGEVDGDNGVAIDRDQSGADRLVQPGGCGAELSQIYDNFLQRHTEAVQQQSFPISDARSISTASVGKDRAPRNVDLAHLDIRWRYIGAGFGLLREIMDRGFRTP